VGLRHHGPSQGHFRADAACHRILARAVQGRQAGRRPVINTTSSSGVFGNVGQGNYGAAKAGIAGLTIIAAQELERYGITVNAIAPTAITRMTADLDYVVAIADAAREAQGFDALAPDTISPTLVSSAVNTAAESPAESSQSSAGRLPF
jgi:NAD(P)-dependent dehydrogenase (short-subunit alcohol dehydrogenase family)